MTEPKTSVTWIAQHLRRRGWRVAKNDSERADADFLASYMDRDGYIQDEPQYLIWLSVVARHELWTRGIDDDVALCWRDIRLRAEAVAEHAAFIKALWQKPEGKRLKVALMWSHCDLAFKANHEMVDLHFAQRDGKPLPATPTLDALGEILMTFQTTTEQQAADHLAWIDGMMSTTGKIGSIFAEAKRLQAEQGLTGDALITWNDDGHMELLPRDDR